MTDPIADLLTRIRNAYLARHQELSLPHSQMKEAIAKLLVKNGYLGSVSVIGKKPFLSLKLQLKYIHRLPAITTIKRISKPGVRHYVDKDHLITLTKGRGTVFLSTSSGIMTVKEAKKLGIGGEIICKLT